MDHGECSDSPTFYAWAWSIFQPIIKLLGSLTKECQMLPLPGTRMLDRESTAMNINETPRCTGIIYSKVMEQSTLVSDLGHYSQHAYELRRQHEVIVLTLPAVSLFRFPFPVLTPSSEFPQGSLTGCNTS